MNAQLIQKDGSVITLTDEQYEQVLATLGIKSTPPPKALSVEEANALLDELQGISKDWDFTTQDLLDERARERQLEISREQRHGIE